MSVLRGWNYDQRTGRSRKARYVLARCIYLELYRKNIIDRDGLQYALREAFQGINGYSISKVLTKRGIPTPCRKKQWQTRVIYSILTNEKYKGDALLQKRVRIDFLTHKSKPNTSEAPQYYIEHDHPAIIRRDIWNEIQDKVTILSNHKSIIDPLRGKIVCRECGGYYGRKTWHSTTTRDKTESAASLSRLQTLQDLRWLLLLTYNN
ncbi:MAG: recombinase family protein [Eubacteriales bacterium]